MNLWQMCAALPLSRTAFSNLQTSTVPHVPTNPPADKTNIDPFAEADEDTGETKQSQNYIHIRIQRKSFLELSQLHSLAHNATFEISLLTLIHSQSAMVVRL